MDRQMLDDLGANWDVPLTKAQKRAMHKFNICKELTESNTWQGCSAPAVTLQKLTDKRLLDWRYTEMPIKRAYFLNSNGKNWLHYNDEPLPINDEEPLVVPSAFRKAK